MQLDTTVQFTGAFRLSPRQASLVAGPNADDGDRNFAPGNISDRTDVFTELDARHGAAGVRLSAAGWYDPAYLAPTANDSPATFNPASVGNRSLTRAVKGLEGLNAELLDAFAHDSFTVLGAQVGVRLGRHTLIWGESLFFGQNGIAFAQAPIDFIKANSVPNTPARELFLPVDQVSGSVQLRPGLSVEAYDQLEWRQDRLAGVGSYYSTADFLDAGGERIITAPGRYLYRTPDRQPGASGQFGAALHLTLGNVDLGLYGLRSNARAPFVAEAPCAGSCSLPGQTGTYRLIYVRGVDVFGASASSFIGNDTIAGEVSFRQGAPLAARAVLGPAIATEPPRGDTLHGQVSVVAERPAGRLWDQATLAAELAGNTVLDAGSGGAPRDPRSTRSAVAIEGQLTLDYFHVLPALNLSPFAAAAYGLAGTSSVDGEMVQGAGDVTLGVQATFRDVWHLDVRATAYIGSVGVQPLADRAFASFNIRRTF